MFMVGIFGQESLYALSHSQFLLIHRLNPLRKTVDGRRLRHKRKPERRTYTNSASLLRAPSGKLPSPSDHDSGWRGSQGAKPLSDPMERGGKWPTTASPPT